MAEVSPRILRLPEVERLTGLKRDSIYRYARQGAFPKPIRLSEHGRASGWVESQVVEYLQKRIVASA